jgi:predicted nucleic acid-binding protein
MDRIYLDTSFFIGLLENQADRAGEARRILDFEKASDRFTSELTVNEFMVRIFDLYKYDPNINQRLEEIETEIRRIARVVALSEDIHREAARIQSKFGELHRHTTPREPRDRKFRWDSIHLATAKVLRCERIYAWDAKWETLPSEIKTDVGAQIIAPAHCLGLFGSPTDQ